MKSRWLLSCTSSQQDRLSESCNSYYSICRTMADQLQSHFFPTAPSPSQSAGSAPSFSRHTPRSRWPAHAPKPPARPRCHISFESPCRGCVATGGDASAARRSRPSSPSAAHILSPAGTNRYCTAALSAAWVAAADGGFPSALPGVSIPMGRQASSEPCCGRVAGFRGATLQPPVGQKEKPADPCSGMV